GTAVEKLGAEGLLDHLPVGGDARVAALTPERSAGLDAQPQLLRRSLQVGFLEGQAFQFADSLDKALLHLLRLEVALDLLAQRGEAGYIGFLGVQELDQMPAELGAHRFGNLPLRQGKQRSLKI